MQLIRSSKPSSPAADNVQHIVNLVTSADQLKALNCKGLITAAGGSSY
jgi:hypothetical protein